MRTTVDLNESLFREAFKITHLRTKKELLNLSLKELIRIKHIENLKKRLGNYKFNLSLRQLDKIRNDG